MLREELSTVKFSYMLMTLVDVNIPGNVFIGEIKYFMLSINIWSIILSLYLRNCRQFFGQHSILSVLCVPQMKCKLEDSLCTDALIYLLRDLLCI